MDNTQELLDCLKPVESSMFTRAGYSEAHWTLVLAFKSTGEVKGYRNCAPEVADEALSAESLGKWWNANIKGNPAWEAEIIGAEEVPAKEPKASKAKPVPVAEGGITDDDIRLVDPNYGKPSNNFAIANEDTTRFVGVINGEPQSGKIINDENGMRLEPFGPEDVFDGPVTVSAGAALTKQTEGEILSAWTAPGSAAEALDLLAERDSEIRAIIAQNVKTGAQALTIKVDSEQALLDASEALTHIVAKKDTTFAALDPLRKCLYDVYSEAGDKVKQGIEPLKKGEDHIKLQIVTWKNAQERIRQQRIREENERRDAEARRLQEEEAARIKLADVQDAIDDGDEERAQTLFDAPAQAPRPYVPPTFIPPAAPKVEGQSSSTTWKVDRSLVEDDETGQAYIASITKLLRAVKDGSYPIEQAAPLLSWDFAAADKLASALMAAFAVPGLQAAPATTLRVSRGKKKK
jgi:hypothetical protein